MQKHCVAIFRLKILKFTEIQMEVPKKNINFQKTALYIHIPFCVSKCKYCDFFSVPCDLYEFSNIKENKKLAKNIIPNDYIDALCNEIDFRFNCGKTKILLDSIYIGGGTPSLLSKKQLEKIFFKIKKSPFLEIAENCEITTEINPDDVTLRLLSDYLKIGITRISCGIQSMNEKSLKYVKRRSSEQINKKALEILSLWQKDLSVDFICGLPYETEKSFTDGLVFVLKSLKNLSHISMYSLTIEDETPLGKELKSGILEYDFEKADKMWLKSCDFLEKKGFFQYEVSNFCKNGKESKHNLKYWNHEDYFGVGAGATGTLYKKDGSGIRWTNVCNVSKYIDFWKNFKTAESKKTKKSKKNDFENFDIAEKNQDKRILQISEQITQKNSEFEYFMMGLRKISGISKNHFEKTFLHEIPRNFTELCEKWNKKKLCNIINKKDDVIFTLGKNGILFLNQFLESLLENE